MKVIISNPIKHHTHHLIIGLSQRGYFARFFTSVWIKTDGLFLRTISMLPFVGDGFVSESKKRLNAGVPADKVETFPIVEFVRKILRRKSEAWVFISERAHDAFFARRLTALEYDIFIGSEKCSRNCFRQAKRHGKIAILDLAQVHYKKIETLRAKFKTLDQYLVSGRTLERINRIKEEELALADFVFTLSDLTRKSLTEAGIPENKIRLINLGFDPSRFTLKSYSRRGDFTILYVGAITRRKGVELICQAVRQLKETNNVRFRAVGAVLEEDLLEEYENVIEYSSYAPHDQLVRYYQAADVFVFPSYLDSWGMVVLEAMACGTPAIISENTGSKDVVAKGGGYVIPVDDVGALVYRLQYLIDHPDELEKLGREAHQIAQLYTWQRYYDAVNIEVEMIFQNAKIKS